MNKGKYKTLLELFLDRAQSKPNAIAFYYLVDGEEEEISITYEALLGKASRIAARLQALQLEGERALLLYPSGLDYICGFWACLLAKVIAVPAYSPRSFRADDRLLAMLHDCKAKAVLSTSKDIESRKFQAFKEQAEQMVDLQVLATDKEFKDSFDENWRIPEIDGSQIAFLQYTSGSTSEPKGVVDTHSNLLGNSEIIHRVFQTTPESFCVSWLPLYHDMGLIGTMLQPIYMGFPGLFMSPAHFVQRPQRWLNAISKYKADIAGSPNFGYDMCADKIDLEKFPEMDLSCWKLAFNGGEPVHHQTLERFSAKFSAVGFEKSTFAPCYGMAENTLMICGNMKGLLPRTLEVDAEAFSRSVIDLSVTTKGVKKILVSSGDLMQGVDIAIVNPKTGQQIKEGTIGEIWVAGDSVTKGYWKNEAVTQKDYYNYLEEYKQPYLRTGDLGFVFEGALYITGRLKEMMIIRGLNYFPQDIERVAQECDVALVRHSGAAFTIERSELEELCLVQEINRHTPIEELPLISRKIKSKVFENFGLNLKVIHYVSPLSIPKTTSGKIQRFKCKKQFLSNELRTILRT